MMTTWAWQLKEIHQINKKNHQMLCQQQEEEYKQKKDKTEAAWRLEEGKKAAKLAKLQCSNTTDDQPLSAVSTEWVM